MTTSLEELCSTEQQRAIARRLTDAYGILTDGDLLLADDTVLKRSALSQSVLPRQLDMVDRFRTSMSFPGQSFTPPSIPFAQTNSLQQHPTPKDSPQVSRNSTKSCKEDF
jgi:hypothetical protein